MFTWFCSKFVNSFVDTQRSGVYDQNKKWKRAGVYDQRAGVYDEDWEFMIGIGSLCTKSHLLRCASTTKMGKGSQILLI